VEGFFLTVEVDALVDEGPVEGRLLSVVSFSIPFCSCIFTYGFIICLLLWYFDLTVEIPLFLLFGANVELVGFPKNFDIGAMSSIFDLRILGTFNRARGDF